MVTLVCDNIIAENKLNVVAPYYAELVKYSRKHQGCISYDVYQSREVPNCLTFVETWMTDEDLDNHLNDPVFLQMFKKIENYMIEPEVIRKMDNFL
ncbi:MAG: putative quinol monooxygenase [Lachnospiraceae bacterium]|nr:putative quinol monooxygenase [Lachnospiraceae bacterium]